MLANWDAGKVDVLEREEASTAVAEATKSATAGLFIIQAKDIHGVLCQCQSCIFLFYA